MKKLLYILAALLLALTLTGCGYRKTIAGLETEVAQLLSENNSLNEDLAGLRQEASLLESTLDELLSATPEPTPEPLIVSLGITPDQLNENMIYLIDSVFTTLEPLPEPEPGTSPNGNPTQRYPLTRNISMVYTLNILGQLQSVEVSYDFTRLSDKEAGKFGNYTALAVTAYVMALESPLEYSGLVAMKSSEIITSGRYLDGRVIMASGSFPNRQVMRLYADFN